MRVIGTAGHVDHGKSTLVRTLTQIDPDRLAEEKARQLTIDLGFAWFDLPDGETIGIVDVPGHRDFIENMLAGIAGIDAVLLVVAADEGIMPQTREHLAIIDLLGIQNGLIVLSKIDLVEDIEWLDLVELDVRDTVQGTILQDAPMLRLSAHSGNGLAELVDALSKLLASAPTRSDYRQPRLPIDRVFTIEGFGTVVTGTLAGGTLRIGDTIEIQPSGLQGRVRGLQSYQRAIEAALPGSRVAVNVSGIAKDQIMRGHVLTFPNQLEATHLIDVQFRYLPDLDRPLKHNAEVKFFSGASESLARVRLLNSDSLAPDATGWLQLRLEDPIPVTLRDRFILRYPSPPQTIGGGVIVNPHPAQRWKRFRSDVIADLQTRLDGTPAERVIQAAQANQPVKRVHLQQNTGFDDVTLEAALTEALETGYLTELEGLYLATERVQDLLRKMQATATEYHANYPLRLGITREVLRSQLRLKQAFFNQLLSIADDLVLDGQFVRLPAHAIRFTASQEQAIDRLLGQMEADPYTTPSFSDAATITGEDVLYALIERGEIVQVQPEVIFTHSAYEQMVTSVLTLIVENGSVDAKQVRDHFSTSRKYAIGLLEHMDEHGLTRRDGDLRVLGKNAFA